MLEAKGIEDHTKNFIKVDWGGNLWSGTAG
jgi:hypothetical protein